MAMNKPMEVGKSYDVLCVRANWQSKSPGMGLPLAARWIPVIGPIHDDLEVLGFEPRHWHVDFRFLRKKDQRTFDKHFGHRLVYTQPITAVLPDLPSLDCTVPGHRHWLGSIRVDELPHEGIPPESYMRVMRRKMMADYPSYPRTISWLRPLEDAYQGHRLKAGMVCPHKGVDLSGIQPVDGVITCPLHGLGWCAETGELVRTTKPAVIHV